MELVIELDKEMYEDANILIVKDLPELKKSIAEGKPLQKGHGNLIDIEKAKKFLYERLDRLGDDELYDIFSRIIDDMYNELPSVIEADKAESEE